MNIIFLLHFRGKLQPMMQWESSRRVMEMNSHRGPECSGESNRVQEKVHRASRQRRLIIIPTSRWRIFWKIEAAVVSNVPMAGAVGRVTPTSAQPIQSSPLLSLKGDSLITPHRSASLKKKTLQRQRPTTAIQTKNHLSSTVGLEEAASTSYWGLFHRMTSNLSALREMEELKEWQGKGMRKKGRDFQPCHLNCCPTSTSRS